MIHDIINDMTKTSSITLIISDTINHPSRPTITGPTSGKNKIEYEYSIVSICLNTLNFFSDF